LAFCPEHEAIFPFINTTKTQPRDAGARLLVVLNGQNSLARAGHKKGYLENSF
jgi:hypothetical protein